MIVARDLQKAFHAVPVLQRVSFEVKEGEFYVLLGPSGCGKTTTLRCLAGLEHPDGGEITMQGRAVFSSAGALRVPAEERPIAMVFQSYALWPHMDVYDNIAFPLKHGIRRVAAGRIRPRAERAAELLNLTPYLRRPVSQLSGGQQQRVALARAIALEPAVLLMDEPLSNLDARLRARLRVELKALTRSIGITTIYVTHDQIEAMVMGDRIAVMESGRILQEGGPADLYQRPRELFVARFLGDMNLVPARLLNGASGTAGFRPEDALLRASGSGHGFPATVVARHYVGDANLYQLDAAGAGVQVRAPKAQTFETGARLFVEVDPACCILFETTEEAPKP